MKKGVISALSAIAGGAVGATVMRKKKSDKLSFWMNTSNKHLSMIKLYDSWMESKAEGKSVSEYFKEYNISTIAIYGMSYIGMRLYKELKDSGIEVKYGIDKNVGIVDSELDIISPEDNFEDVDAIVVTAFSFFDEIEEKLSLKIEADIISIEDIIYEL